MVYRRGWRKRNFFKKINILLIFVFCTGLVTIYRPKIVEAATQSSTVDANNGDWSLKSITLKNTPEADLMVRAGNINNFGFGWSANFDPFSGNSTNVHGFPWTPPTDTTDGTDRIMVNSGYIYNKSVGTDGYTSNSLDNNHKIKPDNAVRNINMQYNLSGITVNNAILQMFVDDFQAGSKQPNSNSNFYQFMGKWQAYINGVEVPELETVINNLNQSGPIGRMISFSLPSKYLDLVRSGSLAVNIDSKTSSNYGDGYAIDFVKLLVNPISLSQTCTVNGIVKNSADNSPIAGAIVSAGGVVQTTSLADGSYTLTKVPAGAPVITASCSGYANLSQTIYTVAQNSYSLDFSMLSTSKPGLPQITENPITLTNQNVQVSVSYPDNPTVKQISVSKNNGSDNWISYNGAVTVGSDWSTPGDSWTIKTRSQSAAGVWSDTASTTVNNIDKSVPSAPILSQDITAPTNKNVTVTAQFPASGVKTNSQMISVDGGLTFTAYSTDSNNRATVTLSNNATVMAKYTNLAGTDSLLSILNVSNIDKSTPASPVITSTPNTLSDGTTAVAISVNYPGTPAVQKVSFDNGVTWYDWSSVANNGTNVMTSNNTVQAYSVNAAGTSSVTTKLAINTIVPGKPVLSQDITSPTNKNVNVTIKYPASSILGEYSIDNGTHWIPYTGPITINTSNTTVQAVCYDRAGTSSSVGSITITNIDKTTPTAPILTPDITVPTNGNVTVTAQFPSTGVQASSQMISLDGGQTFTAYIVDSNSKAIVILTNNATVEAKYTNLAGTESTVAVLNVTNIDKTTPAAPILTQDITVQTNQNVTVTALFPLSGVKANSQMISVDGGQTFAAYTVDSNNKALVTLSANATVEAKYTNLAGTESTVGILKVSNIDKSVPAAPIITTTPNTLSDGTTAVAINVNYPGATAVQKISLDNGATWYDWSNFANNRSNVMTSNNTVQAYSVNAVGTSSVITKLPITTIVPGKPILTQDITVPTNKNVNVTIQYPISGAIKQYSIDGGNTWNNYTSSITIYTNTIVKAKCYDSAGTSSEVASISITNIDKSTPAAPILTPNITAPTNGNVIVTAQFPSAGVQANSQMISLDGGQTFKVYTVEANNEVVLTLTINATVEAKYTNLAGTESTTAELSVTNIDKTTPAAPILTPDITAPTNGNVTVTAQFPLIGVKDNSEMISLDGGQTFTAYTVDANNEVVLTLTSNATVESKYTNLAGTESTIAKLNVTNIDKSTPAAPVLTPDITAPTNGNVAVTVQFPSIGVKANSEMISLDGGQTFASYTVDSNNKASVTLSSNATVEAKYTNLAGTDSTIATLNVTNIDKTSPTATIDVLRTNSDGSKVVGFTSKSKDSIVVTSMTSSPSKVGTADYTNEEFTCNANCTVTFNFKDAAGNTNFTTCNVIVGTSNPIAPGGQSPVER